MAAVVPLTFEIASVRARAAVPRAVASRLAPFSCAGGSMDVEFDLLRRPPPAGDVALSPRVFRRNGSVRLSNPYLSVELRRRAGAWRVRGSLSPRLVAWDSLLRAVWSWILMDRGGMLLHASAAVVRGHALLFPGPSGSGKSTLARKAGRVRMLSDDTLAVIRQDGRWRATATPFYSFLRSTRTGSWPIRGLFFPVKRSRRVSALAPAPAVVRLLRNVIWFSTDAEASRRVVSLTGDLVRAVPAAELGSVKRESFDRVLERVHEVA